ncbi:polyketide cyclase / dehydrase and lipid transport [Hoyosella rhizosphaerae]|uniref:polyketide cyclase / dehydrase and lipid transport n=1 Tax=Hoyosella rhizosphaerae TaxID=1755582 RepID=UPI001669DFF6|nr:polyketide cyclase / dehydrase and lipid transport [Hoyosella rhizosphaerae]MBN4927943.1 polyketide cyclase / dehydrase and lipid transport [Hoyosella rhizosphaerae]
MSSIHVADDTFVAAPPAIVAEVFQDQRRWRRWWPDLRLDVRQDRGEQGIRWLVAGKLDGTMEVWLEPNLDGTTVHYFLHAEPVGGNVDIASLPEANRARRVAGRAMALEVKFLAEQGRRPGEPAVGAAPAR